MITLIICAILLALCLISILVWQGLTRPEMSKTQVSPVLNQVIGTLTPGEDLLLISGGEDVSVLVPACAFDKKGKIVLTPLGQYQADQDSTESGWMRPRTANVSYYDKNNKLVENFQVSCAIRVCFTLSNAEWNHYLAATKDFDIQYLDNITTPSLWTSLLMIDKPETHKLCGYHNRLGLFALAMKNSLPRETVGPYDIEQPTVTPTRPSGLYEAIFR